jgi:hypothetical protein
MSGVFLFIVIVVIATVVGTAIAVGIRLIIEGFLNIKQKKKEIEKVEKKESLIEKQIDEIFRSKC